MGERLTGMMGRMRDTVPKTAEIKTSTGDFLRDEKVREAAKGVGYAALDGALGTIQKPNGKISTRRIVGAAINPLGAARRAGTEAARSARTEAMGSSGTILGAAREAFARPTGDSMGELPWLDNPFAQAVDASYNPDPFADVPIAATHGKADADPFAGTAMAAPQSVPAAQAFDDLPF